MATVNLTKISGNAEPTISLNVQSRYRVDAQYPAEVTLRFNPNKSVTFYVTDNTTSLVFPTMPTYTPETVSFEYNPDSYTEPSASVAKGASGNNVYWVQTRLYELGYAINVDGSFGTATELCVKQFQGDNNLYVDGSVGAGTRGVLATLWEEKKATQGHTLPSHDDPLPANLWDDLPTTTAQTITATATTHNFGGNTDSGSKALSLTLVANSDTYPSVSDIYFAPRNEDLPSKFDNVAIQGISTYEAVAYAAGQKGAFVKEMSLYVEENGDDYYYHLDDGDEPEIINDSEQFTFDVGIIDQTGVPHVTVTGISNTRGFEKTYADRVTISASGVNIKPYSKPTIQNLSAFRVDNLNTTQPNRSGETVRIEGTLVFSNFGLTQPGQTDNTCILKCRYKTYNSSSWSNWQNVTINSHIESVTFAKNCTYNLELKAVDDITSAEDSIVYSIDIPPEDVPLHLGEGGKKIAIGTYCTDIDNSDGDRTFLCDWKAVFNQLVKMKNGLNVAGTASVTSLNVNGNTVSDFVVEEGEDVIYDQGLSPILWWSYRKWASGIQEVWGKYPFNSIEITAGGQGKGYGYSLDSQIKEFPTFNGISPQVILTVEGNEWIYPVVKEITDSGNIQLLKARICAINAQTVSGTLHIYMKGNTTLGGQYNGI